jgi:hypothetical protein
MRWIWRSSSVFRISTISVRGFQAAAERFFDVDPVPLTVRFAGHAGVAQFAPKITITHESAGSFAGFAPVSAVGFIC